MLVNLSYFKRCIHPNSLNISLFMFCCIRPLTSLFVKRCQVISLIYNIFCVMTFYKYLISVGRWLSSFTVYDSNLNPVLHNKIIELPRPIWKLCFFEWSQNHYCVNWNYPNPLQAAVVWNSNVLIWIRIHGFVPFDYVSGSGSRSCFFLQWLSRCQQKLEFKDNKLLRSDNTNFVLVYDRIRIQSWIHQAALTHFVWQHYFHYLKEIYSTVTFLTFWKLRKTVWGGTITIAIYVCKIGLKITKGLHMWYVCLSFSSAISILLWYSS